MSEIHFTKVVGAGNDFIVIRDESLKLLPDRIRMLCDRKRGIGADGLLVIGPSQKADFRMRIFNPDASEAQMCGNGIRCVAFWLYQQGLVPSTVKIETLAGVLKAEVAPEGPEVEMPIPQAVQLGECIQVGGRSILYSRIDTGVPHVVIFCDDVDEEDVARYGRLLRFHELFQPAGTNVNFVQLLGDRQIKVRTYERGVEAETLACGTGVTASALVSHLMHGLASPIEVLTRGGERLQIGFSLATQQKFQRVLMKGPVRIVFEGRIVV